MLDKPSRKVREKAEEGWPLYDVWAKYEEIAMHFNDLLIRLRIQALAGVAALSTLVGIFAKTDPSGGNGNWQIATGVFFGLCLFWIAIWILDLRYYHKLLVGAVTALLEIEEMSENHTRIRSIQMSTIIEKAVAGSLDNKQFTWKEWINLRSGIWAFYVVVFFALASGLLFSFSKATGYIPPFPAWFGWLLTVIR